MDIKRMLWQNELKHEAKTQVKKTRQLTLMNDEIVALEDQERNLGE